ncbi:hypothetical protein ACODT5_26520 [Streptomyces sp. 5.8]|uniref:hypothetical protein n=1 Tax=Streptomyces sp. 5.8 TaxID=3406571 RepID=UPI003BB5058F
MADAENSTQTPAEPAAEDGAVRPESITLNDRRDGSPIMEIDDFAPTVGNTAGRDFPVFGEPKD